MMDAGMYDRAKHGGTEVRGPCRQNRPMGEQRLVLAAKLSSATATAVGTLLKAPQRLPRAGRPWTLANHGGTRIHSAPCLCSQTVNQISK